MDTYNVSWSWWSADRYILCIKDHDGSQHRDTPDVVKIVTVVNAQIQDTSN